MQARGWVIGGIVALLLLACGVCCCAGLGYLMASAPDDALVDAQWLNEGAAAGRAGTTEGCIVAAHLRGAGCGVLDADCNAGVPLFTRACLEAVPSPDPSICSGVPAPSALGDWGAADQLCSARGWASDSGECDAVLEGLSAYCHPE